MDEQAAEAGAPPRRSKRMLVVSALAGVAGLILLTLGVVGFAGASSANDEESELAAERVEAEAQLDDLVQQRAALDERADELDQRESAVIESIDAQTDAGNVLIEQSNEIVRIYQEAVDVGNAGDLAGERAKFESEGGPALLEAAAALDEQRQAHAGYTELLSALGEAVQ